MSRIPARIVCRPAGERTHSLTLLVGQFKSPIILMEITLILVLAMFGVKVIVKRLAAIENLGSINVLRSDKTGTLTEGQIDLHAALDVDGTESERERRHQSRRAAKLQLARNQCGNGKPTGMLTACTPRWLRPDNLERQAAAFQW